MKPTLIIKVGNFSTTKNYLIYFHSHIFIKVDTELITFDNN